MLLIDNLIMAIERHDLPARPLFTIDEVAELLRISKTSVYRLVERRELAFCRVGRTLRFTQADVDAYLRDRRVDSIAATIQQHERTKDPGALVR